MPDGMSSEWRRFKTNSEAIDYLRGLPRYRNSSVKSALSRANVFMRLSYYRLTHQSHPLFVVLVVNNHCDLTCDYCYGDYGNRHGQEYKDYSTAQLLELIDELWRLGTRLLTIHGGEAMLRKDIGEIINYCKLKGFYVSFNTNGFQVAKRIEEIRGVDTLVVSLDGREANNDKHRGAGNFATAVEAIRAGVAAQIPSVISATLTRDNMQDMEYLAELARSLGVRVQYSILYNPEEAAVHDMLMSSEETRRTAQKVLDLKHKGFPVYYSDNVLNTTIHWPGNHDRKYAKADPSWDKTKFEPVPCYHGILKYQIDADGRVVECWATDWDHAPNIKTLGVEGALNKCHDDKKCYHCSLLANNEHNAMMHMSPRTLLNVLRIQVADALKIGFARKNHKRTEAAQPAALTAADKAKLELQAFAEGRIPTTETETWALLRSGHKVSEAKTVEHSVIESK